MDDSRRTYRSLISLSWQTIIYGSGIYARQLAVYLSLPLFTGFMSREEYGTVAVLSSFLAFLNVLTNAGMPAATFRLFNDQQDEENRRMILGAGQQLTAGFALLASIFMVVSAPWISDLMFGRSDRTAIVMIVAVQLLIESLVNYGTILLRLKTRPLATILQSSFHILGQLGFGLLFVMKYQLGALGYFYGFTLGAFIGLLYMLWLVRNDLVFKLSASHVISMVRYGLPLLPATLSLWAVNMIDRILINRFMGLEQVAVYEVGYRVGLLAGLASPPFRAAWPQFAFSNLNKEHIREVYRDILTFLAVIFTFSALIVVASRQLLVTMLAPASYGSAIIIVPWVAFSQIAWGLYPVLVLGLHISKQTTQVATISVIAAVLNIVMNILLIPLLGFFGGALATFFAYSVLAVGSYLLSRRYYSFPIDWNRIIKLAVAAGITISLLRFLDGSELAVLPDLVLRCCVLAAFPLLLMCLRFASTRQIGEVWEFGKHRLLQKLGET